MNTADLPFTQKVAQQAAWFTVWIVLLTFAGLGAALIGAFWLTLVSLIGAAC